MHKFAWTFALALLLVSATAVASIGSGSNGRGERATLDVHQSFQAQRRAIETDLANGETYSELTSKDRVQVSEALDRIGALLSESGDIAGLGEAQKVRVFNDQELVNNILSQAADDSRLVCRREKQIGSNRVTTQCMTALQRDRQAEQARKTMSDSANSSQR
ncbi:hypothetical protein J2X02_000733 [Pseudoxanthomonas japonensis]|uniref:hypothetical protein n=1 Tax=Pseudoxanthomonas japonensis TaxID=69284 RepID=UPI00286528FC|nr:hypothetical protein [Pseudoxanthomonas japonensis]MDR7067916.1 hypothetical protein [Pseudoxanthomonas japonensis]